MKTLLRIDSSIRQTNSVSRMLGDFFVSHWSKKNPEGKIVTRDLRIIPIPHLTHSAAQAFFNGPPNCDDLTLSDVLISEIKTCDELLVTCPMYNFHIPSSLKAYLDHVVRVNETFRLKDGVYTGLLHDKKCYVLTTMGGRKEDVDQEAAFESYLRDILEFMGIANTQIFCIDGAANPSYVDSVMLQAKDKIVNSIFQ